jgi:hypothetical protein
MKTKITRFNPAVFAPEAFIFNEVDISTARCISSDNSKLHLKNPMALHAVNARRVLLLGLQHAVYPREIKVLRLYSMLWKYPRRLFLNTIRGLSNMIK